MAVGRSDAVVRSIQRAPRRGPQSRLTELLRDDVIAWTRGSPRAAILSRIPKRSATYFGAYKPGTAQRIPPLVNTGYGAQYADSERVRGTLVARARIFRSSLALNQGTTVAPAADAARSQSSILARL